MVFNFFATIIEGEDELGRGFQNCTLGLTLCQLSCFTCKKFGSDNVLT